MRYSRSSSAGILVVNVAAPRESVRTLPESEAEPIVNRIVDRAGKRCTTSFTVEPPASGVPGATVVPAWSWTTSLGASPTTSVAAADFALVKPEAVTLGVKAARIRNCPAFGTRTEVVALPPTRATVVRRRSSTVNTTEPVAPAGVTVADSVTVEPTGAGTPEVIARETRVAGAAATSAV
jgi:hypothetical protein